MQELMRSILCTEGEILTLRKFYPYEDPVTGDLIASGVSDTYPIAYIEMQSEADRLDMYGLHISGDAFAIVLPDAYASGGDQLILASGTLEEEIYDIEEVQRQRYQKEGIYDLLILKRRS